MRAVSRPVVSIVVLSGLAGAGAVAVPSASAAPTVPPGPTPAQTRAAPSPVGIVRLTDPGAVLTSRVDPNAPTPGGTAANGENLVIRCQVNGSRKDGVFGASKVWDQVQLGTGEIAYLPDALVQTSTKDVLVAPYCGQPVPGRVGGTQGQCFTSSPIKLLRPSRSRAAFIRSVGPDARRGFRASRVPASVTLAQAILESTSGTRNAGANNYFGIKAQLIDPAAVTFSWGRNAVGCLHQPTTENEGGTNVRQVAQFRLYRTRRGSIVDHAQFLRENPRYASAFRYSRDYKRFARALQKAGYATDPGYSSKLISIIEQEKLTRYD